MSMSAATLLPLEVFGDEESALVFPLTYEPRTGLYRRRDGEASTDFYRRIVRDEQLDIALQLPAILPRVEVDIDARLFRCLPSIIEELARISRVARLVLRKSPNLATERAYRALAKETGCRTEDIVRVLTVIDSGNVVVLKKLVLKFGLVELFESRDLAPSQTVECAGNNSVVIPFDRLRRSSRNQS